MLRPYRIALAPVLFDAAPHSLRAVAVALAPAKILAYNANLERHHLRLTTPVASALFLRGVPLDRIFLRPTWLCPWKRDRTRIPGTVHSVDGRPPDPRRRKVAVLSPYFPFPLAHGGAVRIFHLLREAAEEFDIFLFAFAPKPVEQEFGPVLEFCAKAVVVEQPYYREPRWSTLRPPEVAEFDSPSMRRALAEHSVDLVQVEYTQLASYAGDVLVEHDITWDLFRQVHERERTAASWWDLYRWRRFESRALRRFKRVVVMSDKDAGLATGASVIENGVDLARFTPEPEQPGMRLLFVGSFNHFPNVQAYRFFVEEVWPALRDRFPAMRATIVAGRDHQLYWRQFTGLRDLPNEPGVKVHGFVRDVRPFYVVANVVVVPTVVSAGTNLKVLEAMAMERAVVSTACGCAGLGLEHSRSVWIADNATQFVE
ncbi:MAG: glycosyltransferase, partial [Gammaproteobacteria bacterium]